MTCRTRASLLTIAISLLFLSPLNFLVQNMQWNGTLSRALWALYQGVFSWGALFLAGALILWVVLSEDGGVPPSASR
jgi:hypothetical protein